MACTCECQDKILWIFKNVFCCCWFQLQTNNEAIHLRWLPAAFPGCIRCIVSTSSEHKYTMMRLTWRRPYHLSLDAMPHNVRKLIAKHYFAKYNKVRIYPWYQRSNTTSSEHIPDIRGQIQVQNISLISDVKYNKFRTYSWYQRSNTSSYNKVRIYPWYQRSNITSSEHIPDIRGQIQVQNISLISDVKYNKFRTYSWYQRSNTTSSEHIHDIRGHIQQVQNISLISEVKYNKFHTYPW